MRNKTHVSTKSTFRKDDKHLQPYRGHPPHGTGEKNAILLVDYTNTLRAKGMGRKEAILTAGPVRLRPILMTTFAMIFGMMSIAIGIGEGAETRSPMAIATVGGLLTSLFLTLIVVPAAYDLLDDLEGKFIRKKVSNSLPSGGR